MIQTALRTAGIWIEEGHVLLESLADREVWGIPGGRLEPDESAEEADSSPDSVLDFCRRNGIAEATLHR